MARDFTESMAEKGVHLAVIPVEADGACFFRSVSYLIHGTEDRHLRFRQQTVRYMSANRDHFEEVLQEELDTFGSWEEYIDDLSRPTTWADDHQVASISNSLQRSIMVYDLTRPGKLRFLSLH